jgi:peptidoglycan/LPS O-acetylase OafA/YrhL
VPERLGRNLSSISKVRRCSPSPAAADDETMSIASQPQTETRTLSASDQRAPASRPRLRYQPALDGVRGLGILAVVAGHSGRAVFGHFYYAVDIFFVLSGYLITSLVLQEARSTGGVSFRLFYRRRAARLLPPLVAACLGLLVLAAVNDVVRVRPFLNPTGDRTTLVGVAAALAYMSAWVEGLTHQTLGALDHTWSLSVEEWFYAVWPPLLVLLWRRRRIAVWASVGLAVGAIVYRLASEQLIHSQAYLYFAPDQHACQLLAGCAFGVFMTERGDRLLRHPRAVALAGAAGLLGVLVLMCRPMPEHVLGSAAGAWHERFGAVILAVSALAGIAWLVVVPRSPLGRLFSVSPLVWIGRRSYGLYVYHYVIIELVSPWSKPFGHVPWRTGLVSLVLMFVVSDLSYRRLELPVMRWAKRREEAQRGRRAPQPAEYAPSASLAPVSAS